MTATDTTPELRPAAKSDLPHIARMNRELIEDEGHRNPMNLAQLEDRARHFLMQDVWQIDLFVLDRRAVGFATWRKEDDITEPSGERIYLRQFYISRDARGRGLGRRAFGALMAGRFPRGARVLLEVLHNNSGGRAFWNRMGFAPYATFLERRAAEEI